MIQVLQRVTGILMSFLLIFMVSACGGESVAVVHGLSEYEANEILVILERGAIEASKKEEAGREVTWAIEVARNDQASALRILVSNRLPRVKKRGFAEVYPAESSGMIPTQSEEKAKFLMAMQGELDKKFLSIPGVVEAHSTIVIPNQNVIRDLNAKVPEPTASIAIVYTPSGPNSKPPLSPETVRSLAASSVESLKEENVTVVMQENKPIQLTTITDEGALQDSATRVPVKKFLGLEFATPKSRTKAQVIIYGALALALLCVLALLVLIMQRLRMRRQLVDLESRLKSVES